MNRLRLVPQLHPTAQWMLAHSLRLVGENHAAEKILESATTKIPEYRELGGTYGSSLRDQALVLRTLVENGEKLKAKRIIDEIIPYFTNERNRYLSTQEMAQVLVSLAQFVGSLDKVNDKLTYDLSMADNKKLKNEIVGETPRGYNLSKSTLAQNSLEISNKSETDLFASVLLSGTPKRDDSKAEAQDLDMEVIYADEDGSIIDPKSIQKGTDFIVTYKVKHKGERMDYKNLALTTIFPSGWEIINNRLFDTFSFDSGNKPDYQDIRDDRVYTYFDLAKGEEKIFRFKINATYEGKYWAAPVFCEAMYDGSIRAKSKGFWAVVK